ERSRIGPNGVTLARNRHKSSSRQRTRQKSAPAQDASAPETAAEPPASAKPQAKTWIAAGVAAAIVLAAGGLFALYGQRTESTTTVGNSAEKLSFVGSETCASCHTAEATLWHGSQHAHAMAHATDQTVLGDFNDASFDYYGVHSRFFRKDGQFFV